MRHLLLLLLALCLFAPPAALAEKRDASRKDRPIGVLLARISHQLSAAATDLAVWPLRFGRAKVLPGSTYRSGTPRPLGPPLARPDGHLRRLATKPGEKCGLGLLDPYPSLLGLTVGWNTSSYLRLELGVGRQNSDLSHLITWSLGVKFFVPHWSLSPWLGFNYAAVSHSGPDTILGFNSSGSHGYGGIGLEWTTDSGFTAGLGVQVSTRAQTNTQPFLRFGWFFSI